jgi:hypothetical protein
MRYTGTWLQGGFTTEITHMIYLGAYKLACSRYDAMSFVQKLN